MIYPSVSIIIPCRNEELFIGQCLQSVIANDYPGEELEILVIDGLSTDKTPLILKEFSDRYALVQIYSNPGLSFPSAVNMGIKNAKGELVFIMGAHAKYDTDYIRKCVTYSIEYDAENVGGIICTIPAEESIIGRAICSVLSSQFGVGNSKFRTGAGSMINVDTVFGGCYKRNVFEKYGLFNELLISSSDYEFNRRIKRGGAKILLFPDIQVTYFTRSSFSKFLRNNLRNGFWVIYPFAVSDYFEVNFRHLIPMIFTSFLIAMSIASFFFNICIHFLCAVMLLYLIISIFFSLKNYKDVNAYCIIMPLMFFSLHFTYGLGSLYGLIILLKLKLIKAFSIRDKQVLP